MLKKGDPCYVRLSGGKIFEAAYDEYTGDKQHFVRLPDGRSALCTSYIYEDESSLIPDCRFVCMTGIKGEI